MNSLDYQRIFHEIKNTITLINSSAQLLDSKCPQLQSQPYWNNIRQEITYLKNMVLQISKAGSGQQLQTASVDLHALLQDICQLMQDTYSDLQWDLKLCIGIPIIHADQIKLRQAILNLLKNSVEADSEYITIATQTDPTNAFIKITDSGGGIPKELEAKVFDLFTTSKKEGTGLGLAITKQIVESHGGLLLLDNRHGEGCTFTICLPLAAQTDKQ